MAETGKKQTKRKERGLNVRVTQAQKATVHNDVRVNSYQKKGKNHPSNKEIADKIETTKKDRKKSKKIEETVKDVERIEKIEEVAKNAEQVGETQIAEKSEKVEKFEAENKAEKIEEKTEDVKKAEKSEKVEDVKKPATFSKGAVDKKDETKVEAKTEVETKTEVKAEVKTKAEAKTETKTDVRSDTEIKDKAKEEVKSEQAKLEPNFAEFETMKLRPVEKPASKIVLRDVEKTKTLGGSRKVEAKKKASAEVKKEELPPIIKTNTVVESVPKLSAQEIKEREIAKAVRTAAKVSESSESTRRVRRKMTFSDFGWPRVVLAVACAATAVFAIAYFVNITSTDMSIKVAAMQSGIEATYPSYIPRGYTLSDVTSASGKVIMHFKDGENEFGITEETTNWDSEALLNQYIKENYNNDYTLVREQGLTLYMGANWEAWVNGGVLYKLSVTHGSLTKKQMKSIAVSL